MPSRPFMYETSIELAEKIAEVAKEVFGWNGCVLNRKNES